MPSQFSITNTGTFDVLAGSDISGKPFVGSPIPPTGIVTSNLLVHLDASNVGSYPGSGTTWTNLQGGGYNGSWTTTLGATPVSFVSDGQASYFQTTTQGFQQMQICEIGGLDLRTDFTIEMWIKHDNTNNNQYLFAQGQRNVKDSFILAQYTSNQIFWQISLPENWIPFNRTRSTTTISTSVWNQYVFSYSNSSPYTKKIYKNGQFLTPIADAQAADGQYLFNGSSPSTYFYIPAALTLNSTPTIKIAMFRFYNSVLNETEILQNYNAEKSRYGL